MVVRFLERLVYILHLSRSDECGCHLCYASTTLPSHIPIARDTHDTTRGSHYDNTGPLETTKIGAPWTWQGGEVCLLWLLSLHNPNLSFITASQLPSGCELWAPSPGSHRDVQLNHTETGIPFLQPLLISHCNLFQLKIPLLMLRLGGCEMNFVTFVNLNDSHWAWEGWGVFINRQKSPIQPTTKRILNMNLISKTSI